MMDRHATSSSMNDEMYRSPSAQPNYYEMFDSPLSTKREKIRENRGRKPYSVPRAVRTAPPLSRIYPRRFALQTPHQVSFRGIPPDNIVAHSVIYNPNIAMPYFEQCYTIDRKLGQGSFGEAFAVYCKEDGKRYAVKRALDAFRSSADRALKLREVQKHELLPKHINLVQFYKAWEENGRLYILTELCERSLLDYCNEFHTLPENEIWNIFMDLLMAVDHLHSNDLLHVDIKPENIFLTKDKVCKLGDFGLIFDLKNDTAYTPEEGDAKYLAPEVLNSCPTKAADVFSIGITILEVTTDIDLPSRGDTWHQIRSGNIPDRFFKGVSKDLTRLIKWLISPDPASRPTTAQALSDAAISTRLPSRTLYLGYHRVVNTINEHTGSVLLWLVALVHLLAIPFLMFFDALRRKKNDVCTTPYKGTVYLTAHTPEVNGSIRHKRISRWDDDESDPDDRYSKHNYTSSRRFLEMDDHSGNGDPFPRYRLNFDEDTPSSSSERQENGRNDKDKSTPVTNACAAYKSRTASKLPSTNTKWLPGSGDWSPKSRSRIDDSDDSLEHNSRNLETMSCPPYRQSMRFRCHRRPIPRLDFSRVDEFPETFSSSATATDSTVSSMSSNRSKCRGRPNNHNRMVSAAICPVKRVLLKKVRKCCVKFYEIGVLLVLKIFRNNNDVNNSSSFHCLQRFIRTNMMASSLQIFILLITFTYADDQQSDESTWESLCETITCEDGQICTPVTPQNCPVCSSVANLYNEMRMPVRSNLLTHRSALRVNSLLSSSRMQRTNSGRKCTGVSLTLIQP
ncbi:kinase domain protein [Dictyocaulus viviparus]|uniref:Membrane-associated tyrosine- and threonine-specific cdc2-inhibitory kinase wee-1.3 n=1 Tax=Dictyocaulus viviparus TaxID=29172 RepID=A0A0D8YBF7_DICVI|nr:kinase domain protein [Dictyocaulus viviparus]